MPLIQRFSITTSTITIVVSIVSFVARNRQKQWIDPKHPSLASLAPIACMVTSAVLGASMQWRFIYRHNDANGFWQIPHILIFSALNTSATFFTTFVLCQRYSAIPFLRGRCWRVIRTTIHFLLHASSFVFIVTCVTAFMDTKPERGFTCRSVMGRKISHRNVDYMFFTIIFCFGTHFLLGLLIFSGWSLASLVSPVLSAAVICLKKVASLCCHCRSDWRDSIVKLLDELLLSGEARETEEKREALEMEKLKEGWRERRFKNAGRRDRR